ncbi:protein translocase subunit SecF [Vibrio sp. SS-MA-C1-2]|uniref:protein translocase subunit SecF n=1 Tax=Vibrio sp. SS-MA-C1-2 TaxID=2908646 RepID=UPI001F3D7D34|nr:protein translocase subunit SecF [Vibrio sp. SS-MA-C1-2]UJF16813.1 protein translocase subunit SecF [Vibrio sp. SS-MA-C1-2]
MLNLLKSHIRKIRYATMIISVILTLGAIGSFFSYGLNLGLDFTGGEVTEVNLDKGISNHQLLSVLQPKLGDFVTVTPSGENGRWMIRYATEEKEILPILDQTLSQISTKHEIVSNSQVGSQVGVELLEQGGMALFVSLTLILIYLSFRFEWRLASGALFALFHDVILVLGFFTFTQLEFNLTAFAAILAVLGYSLNDSIIIADRIRDSLINKPNGDIKEINDHAIISTFSRTMVTSGTTLITISALWIMGGESLNSFSSAMFIGVLAGTWSSISIGTVIPEKLKLNPIHYQKIKVDTMP